MKSIFLEFKLLMLVCFFIILSTQTSLCSDANSYKKFIIDCLGKKNQKMSQQVRKGKIRQNFEIYLTDHRKIPVIFILTPDVEFSWYFFLDKEKNRIWYGIDHYDLMKVIDFDNNKTSELIYVNIDYRDDNSSAQAFIVNIDDNLKPKILYSTENYYCMRNPYFRFNLYSFEYDFSFKDLNNDNINDLVDNTTYIFNEPDTVNLIRQFLFNGKSFKPNPSISGFLSSKNKEDVIKIKKSKDGKKQLYIYRNESLKYKSSFTFSEETNILDFAIGRIETLNENFVYIKVEDEKWKTAYYWWPHKKRIYFRTFNKKSEKIISSTNLKREEELNNSLLIIQSLLTEYYNKPLDFVNLESDHDN